MPASSEVEVLHALRDYAEQPKSPGEWARVHTRGVHNDLHLFEMNDEEFRSVLRTLEIKGVYKATDDDHGLVKM